MRTYTVYYASWSLITGEATYSRSFDTEEERDRFAADLCRASITKSVHTWAKDCVEF
jgi:hypothetical protein